MSTFDRKHTNNESRKVNQVSRIPVGGNRDVLTVHNKDPNYEYRVVNDEPGRIEKFKAAGYEVVTGEEVAFGQRNVDRGSSTSSVAETAVGQGKTGVLMKIKKEYYEEDAAARAKVVDQREADLKRNLNSGKDGQYGEVTIK